MPDRLFVYGSLMPGQSNGWRLGPHGAPRRAWVAGRLLDFGRWPGMVPGEGRVHGVVVEVPDAAAVLPELDHYEGYHGPGQDNLFERSRVRAQTADGPVEAWAWWFVAGDAGSGRNGTPVPGGDWVAWRARRDDP